MQHEALATDNTQLLLSQAAIAPQLAASTSACAAAITAAAFLANLFESWLGATVQGRLAWLSNDIVNVVQIVVAAALAMTFVV